MPLTKEESGGFVLPGGFQGEIRKCLAEQQLKSRRWLMMDGDTLEATGGSRLNDGGGEDQGERPEKGNMMRARIVQNASFLSMFFLFNSL